MLTEKDRKKISFIINILFFGILAGIAYFFLKFVFFWVLPFIIAFGVSLIADPIITRLTNKFKLKRILVSTVVITVFLAAFILLAALLSTTLFNEIKSIIGNLGTYLETLISFIQTLPTKYGHLMDGKLSTVLEELVKFIRNYDYTNLLSGSLGSGALKYAGSFITSLPSALVFSIVTIVATYFTAISLPVIKEFILKQFSDKTKELIISIKFNFINTIVKYLKSYFVLMMITFAELSVAFLIFDFKPAITLAFVIAIVDILPILGVG
ncbi:MAG: AI-2E family transporter, partial [Clostridia bacterium]|nr:AI-2E family transporter [Clostridia bacterium]